MSIGWPEGILLILVFLEVCNHMARHGEPRGHYNAGIRLLDAGILLVLLYWGGFFS